MRTVLSAPPCVSKAFVLKSLALGLALLLTFPALFLSQASYADRGHHHKHDREQHHFHGRPAGMVVAPSYYSSYPGWQNTDFNDYPYGRSYSYQPVSYWNPSQLVIGRPLPPGIAKKVVYLPASANYRYGYGPRHRVAVINNDVLITSMVTGALVNILRNAF